MNIYPYRCASQNAELLYLLSDGLHVKVGRTRRRIGTRVSALQTGCPRRIKAIVSVEIPLCAAEAENYCHRMLGPFKTVGEWFKCSLDDAFSAMLVAASAYVGSCWFVHDLSNKCRFEKAMEQHRRNWHGIKEATDGTQA